MALQLYTCCHRPSSIALPFHSHFRNSNCRRFSLKNSATSTTTSDFQDSRKLVLEVKEKLEKDYSTLPVGKHGRDDENMILWFLKDPEFSVDAAAMRLVKAIQWREDFGVSKLTEDSVKTVAETGKSFVHDFLDVKGRPVLVVVACKHFPDMHDPIEDQRLCVYSIEKALSKLPAGQEQIIGVVDLRGFSKENADLKFLTFLLDVFYYYYPKRLAQILFVEAPFVFKTIWRIMKPILKKHASLARFCSVETLREEYFTEGTLPPNFRIASERLPDGQFEEMQYS